MLLSRGREVSDGDQEAAKRVVQTADQPCLVCYDDSLDAQTPDRASAIRASGLPPAQFAAAERDFRVAVQPSNAPAQPLSGPSDVLNSPFAATLAANPTTRPVRPSPLAAPTSASKSKEALLAKAQAIQAGSLFDQTMRAAPVASPAAKGKATEIRAAAATTSADAADSSVTSAAVQQSNGAAHEPAAELQPRRHKRRRMGKVVFGLAIHSSLNRLDEEEEAMDERRRRNRISDIKSSIERLRSSNPTWRYLDSPRDFLVAISPSSDALDPQ